MNIYSFSSLIAGLICFFFSLFVFLKGTKKPLNQAYSLTTLLAGIWTSLPFVLSITKDENLSIFSARIIYFFASFLPTSGYYLMNVLLEEETKKIRFLIFLSLCFAFLSLTSLNIKSVIKFAPCFTVKPGIFYILFVIFFISVFLEIMFKIFKVTKKLYGSRRNQLIYTNLAYLTGGVGAVLHFVSAYTSMEPFPHDIFVAIFPFILTYAILKHRLMDIRLAITYTTIFIITYIFVLGIPFVFLTIAKSWLIRIYGLNWWVIPLSLFVLLAIIGPFVYIYLQKKAENVLLYRQKVYQDVLKQAAKQLTTIHNLKKLLNLIVHTITKVAKISYAAIFLYDEEKDCFILKAQRNLKEKIDYIEKDENLISLIKEQKTPLFYEEIKDKINKKIEVLKPVLIVPGILRDKIIGFLILGEKTTKEDFSQEDIDTFSLLANEATLAIENAILYESMEEEINRKTKELLETQRQLIQLEKLATVGTLAGGVAHEINNPLTAILTNAQILLSTCDNLDEDEKESLQLIEEAAKRCKVIVQKLMLYAKKPKEEEFKEVDLLNVIKNVLSLIGYQLNQENINININAKEKEYKVLGNQNELEQVFTNLILNAKDAIKQIKKFGNINIYLSKDKNKIVAEVEDDGVGIPKEIIPKIFDPFFTTKDVGKGTGLGLSICQAIIERHKGKIFVESEPNKGTKFTIEFPPLTL